jgi:protein TonB
MSRERLAGVAAVALLHIGLVGALVHTLGSVSFTPTPQDVHVTILPSDNSAEKPLVRPLPLLSRLLTRPMLDLAQVPDVPPVVTDTPTAPTPTASTAISIVPPSIDPAHPPARPDYPAISVRLGEEGVTVLSCLVDTNGHVIEAHIKKSSGFARLDDAAVKGALAHFHLRPASDHGNPVQGWLDIPVRWKLVE